MWNNAFADNYQRQRMNHWKAAKCIKIAHYLHDNFMQISCKYFRLSENILQIITFADNCHGHDMA